MTRTAGSRRLLCFDDHDNDLGYAGVISGLGFHIV